MQPYTLVGTGKAILRVSIGKDKEGIGETGAFLGGEGRNQVGEMGIWGPFGWEGEGFVDPMPMHTQDLTFSSVNLPAAFPTLVIHNQK